MDENAVKKLIEQEFKKREAKQRFGRQNVPYHTHDGSESPRINDVNIVPSASIVGTVTITEATTYTLFLNSSFLPSIMWANAAITGTLSGNAVRATSNGSAQLSPTFYLTDNEPTGDKAVFTQDLQFPTADTNLQKIKPAQQSNFLWTTRSNTSGFYAGTSRDHIVSVYNGLDPTDVDDYVRITVTDFGKDSITLEVPILVSGWTVYLNVYIT